MIDTTYLSTSEINNLKVTERHVCELCDVVTTEDDLTPYDGYKACSECIEASEAAKKENEAYEVAYDNGASRRTIEILEILKGDKFSEARRLIIEGINK